MKKVLVLFSILLCATAMTYAQSYKIKHIYNAKSIKIGGVNRGEGYVFPERSTSQIDWPNYKVGFDAYNVKTGKIRYFCKRNFERTKSISLWDFICKVFVRHNIRATRSGHLEMLRDVVEDSTFYIQQDTLFVESPMDIDSACFFVMDYYKDNRKVRQVLPQAECVKDIEKKETAPYLIFTRSMFNEENDFFDYKVAIRFVVKKNGKEILITDRMNIVCLPYEFEYSEDE